MKSKRVWLYHSDVNIAEQDLEIVEVASLLHDIQDWKYSGSEAAAATTVQVHLRPTASFVPKSLSR